MEQVQDKQTTQKKSEVKEANEGGSFLSPPEFSFENGATSQRKSAVPVQRKSSEGLSKTPPPFSVEADPIQQKTENKTGMPDGVKAKMEKSFGQDFSDVNIHQNSDAAVQMKAHAYAQGNDIHFAPGQFKPDAQSGQELLGHELSHVVQQRQGRVQPTVQAKGLNVNDDRGLEREADIQGAKAARGEATQYKSASGTSLSTGKQVQAKMAPIQMSLDTAFGEWHMDRYDLRRFGATGRGVQATVRFDPGANVDAEKIGVTQSLRSRAGGNPFVINNDPTLDARAIDQPDAINITEGASAGETDENTYIDRVSDRTNPIYGSAALNAGESLSDTQMDNNTTDDDTEVGVNATYQLGMHYTDDTGAAHDQDASIYDFPKIRSVNVSRSSKQIFETTALALSGNQQDTYYGSLEWGWQTDAAGNFTTIEPRVVSQGVPSSTFMKAASEWNVNNNSTGADLTNLPTVDVMLTTRPVSQNLPDDFIGPGQQLPAGTRVQVISAPVGDGDAEIRAVDGPLTGTTIGISQADYNSLSDERD